MARNYVLCIIPSRTMCDAIDNDLPKCLAVMISFYKLLSDKCTDEDFITVRTHNKVILDTKARKEYESCVEDIAFQVMQECSTTTEHEFTPQATTPIDAIIIVSDSFENHNSPLWKSGCCTIHISNQKTQTKEESIVDNCHMMTCQNTAQDIHYSIEKSLQFFSITLTKDSLPNISSGTLKVIETLTNILNQCDRRTCSLEVLGKKYIDLDEKGWSIYRRTGVRIKDFTLIYMMVGKFKLFKVLGKDYITLTEANQKDVDVVTFMGHVASLKELVLNISAASLLSDCDYKACEECVVESMKIVAEINLASHTLNRIKLRLLSGCECLVENLRKLTRGDNKSNP
ncbi:hypothetical protein AKO1_003573 [Acrasis kona]|uniref:Uncharacterized protein n=1 Tax=Acrasis kona TaxID=1008807 RepID=A0AAW2Z5Z8_9EUKA